MKHLIFLTLMVFLISSNLFSQMKTISGIIQDENGDPLPGATVLIKNTTNGTISNPKGEYSIYAGSNDILIFSFIGMQPAEVPVADKTTINVTLTTTGIVLDEIVAIGYGSMKKSDLTGSVVSVKATDAEKMGQTAIGDLLQGRAAGVQISGTNIAGGSRSIRIRGASSINASSEPLYVIDGLPLLNGGIRASNGVEDISSIANIDPNTIESIEVLKDASATAIYGSQGANGVIIITTKKAISGKLETNFKINNGITILEPNYKSMDAYQYAYYTRNVLTNPYPYTHDKIPVNPDDWGTRFYYLENWKAAPTTDWLDLVTRNGSFKDYALSMRGGSEKQSFSVSIGYLNNKGVVNYTNFDRFTGDFNSEIHPNDYLSFSLSSKLSYINNDGVITQSTPDQVNAPTGAVMAALSFDPTIPYDPTNMAQYFVMPDGYKVISPAVNLAAQTRNSRRYDGWLSGGMKLFFSKEKNLSFESKFSGRYGATKNNSFDTKYSRAGKDWGGANGGIAIVDNNYNLFYMWDNLINYNKKIGKHSISLLAGQEYQNNYSEGQSQRSINFPIDLLGTYNLAMADPLSHDVPGTSASEWTIMSYFGRFNYSYDSKYLATFTYRADGSSRFSKNNKWGYFPSGAVAWTISEEDFMKSLPVINFLKLRTGWGVTGNQSIGTYQSQALMGTFSAYFPEGQQTMALRPERLANDDLKWESTTQFNYGLDLSLLNSRLNFTADYYNKITKDLLMTLNIPPTSGFSSILTNVGQISNTGVELLINTRNIVKNDFIWSTTFNFAHNKNNIDDLGSKGNTYIGKSSYQEIITEGEPLGCWYGMVTDGVWTQNDLSFVRDESGTVNMSVIPGHERATLPGEVLQYGSLKLKDISGPNGVPDGVINDLDRVIVGRSQPKFFGGITNTFTIKSFSINIFCDYSFGNQVYNHMKQSFVAVNEGFNHYAVDYYFPTIYELGQNNDGLYVENKDVVLAQGNPDGKYPTNAARAAGLGGYTLDMFVEDASYFRVKELSVTYVIPGRITQKALINRCQIFLKASNLYTFTKYSGNDPTVVNSRDWNPYPTSRTYQIGANFSF